MADLLERLKAALANRLPRAGSQAPKASAGGSRSDSPQHHLIEPWPNASQCALNQ
jgi:hypothetical protein